MLQVLDFLVVVVWDHLVACLVRRPAIVKVNGGLMQNRLLFSLKLRTVRHEQRVATFVRPCFLSEHCGGVAL